MAKTFLEVEEVKELAGNEKTKYFFSDEKETDEPEADEEDRKGGKTDA